MHSTSNQPNRPEDLGTPELSARAQPAGHRPPRLAVLAARTVVDLPGIRNAGLVMIALAAAWPWLPLPNGSGPPCPLRTVTGLPCPLCGMTTSVVATVHGQFATALAANPFGLVVVAIVSGLALRTWAYPRIPLRSRISLPVATLVAIVAASWVFQLYRYDWLPLS